MSFNCNLNQLHNNTKNNEDKTDKNADINYDYSSDESFEESLKETSYFLAISSTLNHSENKMDYKERKNADIYENIDKCIAEEDIDEEFDINTIPFTSYQNVANYLYEQSLKIPISIVNPRIVVYINGKRYIENPPYSLEFYHKE